MTTDIWAPLAEELDGWKAEGRTARFWLRDDDAVEPTPALARLLENTSAHSVPLTLAVIPVNTGALLADYLASYDGVSVAVHGWSHTNHAPEGEKKQELGLHRPVETVLAELSAGREKLQQLHAARYADMLIPPWNRVAAPIVERLPEVGFKALSVFGREKSAPLRLINTHVDLMDWHGTRSARDYDLLVAEIVGRLKAMRETGGITGFLTHHLVHDARAWEFTEALIGFTASHPAAAWIDLRAVLSQP